MKKAFIVGAGNLGTALAKYEKFHEVGLDILALFDNDKNKIGKTINGKLVLHVDKLPNLIRKSNIDIVILTLPEIYAQVTVDVLVSAGVKNIWNFTPCILNVPKSVIVKNENLAEHFLQFASSAI